MTRISHEPTEQQRSTTSGQRSSQRSLLSRLLIPPQPNSSVPSREDLTPRQGLLLADSPVASRRRLGRRTSGRQGVAP